MIKRKTITLTEILKTFKLFILAFVFLTMIHANQITFKELVSLASADLKKTIYLDKDIKDYKVDFNIVGTSNPLESYSLLRKVLQEHDLMLTYDFKFGFYTVEKKIIRKILPPLPVPSDVDTVNYYSYKVKNITNKDVLEVVKIFDMNYTYLKQSDVIAYACTQEKHIQVEKLLETADTITKQVSLKISIFTVNKNKMKEIGSKLESFYLGLDNSFNLTNAMLDTAPQAVEALNSFNMSIYFSAMESRGLIRTENTPTILLTNGIRAKIESVSNVRYITGVAEVEDAKTSKTEEYEYRDIGLKINIMPKIRDDFVYIDLDLTSEDFINYEKDNPTVSKIHYKNSFKIHRNEPLLLTGINKSKIIDTNKQIPLLHAIPLIGELFKNKEDSKEEQNINILIEVL